MKLAIRRSTRIGSVFIAIAASVVVALTLLQFTQKSDALEGDGRLITIYDRGEEQVLLSTGETIADALDDAGVTLEEKDVVEPAIDEKMIAPEYKVNIYRARPVTVIDGPVRQKVMTAYQTADQIVRDVAIDLHDEDIATMTRSSDFVNTGAGLHITIDRAVPFTFDLYGSTSEARTQGETVGEMLEEKGITLGENDRVSPDRSTEVREGMTVKVWREGKQTITVEETVAFEVEQIRDADRPVGYKEVQTAGVEGSRKVTYEIEIRDGQEISRNEIASLVTRQPAKQVEVIGTKPNYLPYTGGGTKSEWLAASNIPEESWGYADFMVTRESGWNPNAMNASSGACGLAQALPCSKVPGNPLDPVNSLNWMNGYVNGRYGGWEGAYNFWQQNHWY